MKYLCLVYLEESKLEALSKSEFDRLADRSLANNDALRKSGHFIAAQALEFVRDAVTVRVRKGTVSVTDGPFAETKEQLGGFLLIEAKDLDDAIQVVQKTPMASFGSIEVRPVRELIPSGERQRNAGKGEA